MIIYVATEQYLITLKRLLKEWSKSLRPHLRPMAYDELFSARELPQATYIFTDYERLTPAQMAFVAQRWDALEGKCPLLNDPRKVKGRLELLNRLSEMGQNDFRIYRASEVPDDVRYPVFLRLENDHKGARSKLLHTRDELDAAYIEALSCGLDESQLLVTEYMETKQPNGFYRKYSVFKVGDRFIPRHVNYDQQWIVKYARVHDAEIVKEQQRFLRDNPHEDQVRLVFELAEIDYGRIDYDIISGKMQVWEINTNPTVMGYKRKISYSRRPTQQEFANRFTEAILKLDTNASGTVPVPPITLDRQRPLHQAASRPTVLR